VRPTRSAQELFDAKGTDRVRFSADFPANAKSVVLTACAMKLEGIIAKRKDARYVSERTETWLKLECSERQEFVIVGFTDRSGAPNEVGGLLLGYHEDGKLDPGERVKWAQVQEAAVLMRTLLTELGLESWLKTSGGKGLRVVVPLAPRLDYEVVKGFSQAVVRHLAKTIPSRFVAKSWAPNRIGRIFVDYLRNGHGQTTAAALSARARARLGVSMPVTWEALLSLKSGAQCTIATAREYLSFQTDDPWFGYWKGRPGLRKR
jgi:ATP-dependent DNA ligase